MSNLSVFQFESQDVRFVDGKPVANDVAKILGYTDPAKAVSTKVKAKNKGVTKLVTAGGVQSVTVLEESGIYQLIFSSKLPSAEKFQDWVFEDVLPSIRQTGGYGVVKTPQTYIEALEAIIVAEKEKELLRLESEQLKEENLALAEAVDELFDYSSIIRVAKWNNLSEKDFKWRALKRASKEMGEEVKQVPCPRFGTKNLYSHNVWRYCYPNVSLPETTTLVIKPY